jgi:hypothetical protein
VNALQRPEVGKYLNRHFVSAFQKVATFQVNGAQKQGGNVAAYFCTPDGRVLHAIAGPVNGMTLLQDARWANETYQLAQMGEPNLEQLQIFFRKAHLERLRHEHGVPLTENRLPRPDAVTAQQHNELLLRNQQLGLRNDGKVHLLLAVGPLPRLENVYRAVFERILNERISTNPVAVAGR